MRQIRKCLAHHAHLNESIVQALVVVGEVLQGNHVTRIDKHWLYWNLSSYLRYLRFSFSLQIRTKTKVSEPYKAREPPRALVSTTRGRPKCLQEVPVLL